MTRIAMIPDKIPKPPPTLEEMRASEQAYRDKKLKIIPITKAEYEYAQRLKEERRAKERTKTMSDVLQDMQKNSLKKLGKAIIYPLCDYRTARRLTWEAMKIIANKHGFEWIINQSMKDAIEKLVLYFFGIHNQVIDHHKGIYLWGNCGVGKTRLMESFQFALQQIGPPARTYKINSIPKIYDDIQQSSKMKINHLYAENRCLDDAGYSADYIRLYGNTVNPINELLTHRYDRMRLGEITHITSNLPLFPIDITVNKKTTQTDSLSRMLDARVISRSHAMFNVIRIQGPDYRRNNL